MVRRNKTRRNRNKTEGGSSCGLKLTGGKRRNKSEGGKRKTRKMSKGADQWRQAVMGVFKEMKSKDKNASFSDALREASKRKKAGTLY
jgi:hypothetical protein